MREKGVADGLHVCPLLAVDMEEVTRLEFPSAPIDGRQWHSHRQYPGVDHGCPITWDHNTPNTHECHPHVHDKDPHPINILRDAGVSFTGDKTTAARCSCRETVVEPFHLDTCPIYGLDTARQGEPT